MQFMSLREFLLLKEPVDTEPKRSAFRAGTYLGSSWGLSPAESLVKRYDIAKASWEKYGADGPPTGTLVQNLTGGDVLVMGGTHEEDPRFFVCYYNTLRSIFPKEIWFVYFREYFKGDEIDRLLY